MKTSNSWYFRNKEYAVAYQKQYSSSRPDENSVRRAKRRASLLNRIPPWFTKEMQIDIQSFYKKAREASLETGVKHVVDHIVPLQGENVSGLHVPWNLCVVTNRYNSYKKNNKQFCQKMADLFLKKEIESIDKNNSNVGQSIRVYCFQNKKFYGSMLKAAKELNVPVSDISQICNGKYGRKTTGGYSFCFANGLSHFDNIDNLRPKIIRKTKSRPCKNETTGQVFESMNKAAIFHNINSSKLRSFIEKKKAINGVMFSYTEIIK